MTFRFLYPVRPDRIPALSYQIGQKLKCLEDVHQDLIREAYGLTG